MSKVGGLGWGVGKTDIMGGDALFHTILANFTTIAIPKKKTRRHSWRQKTYKLLKCKPV